MENTQALKTSNGHDVVLKSFVTARDMREIKDMYLAVAKFDGKGGDSFDIDVSKANEIENKTLELVVVSLDGKTEGIIDLLLDLRVVDYDEILAKVQELTGLDKKKPN